LEVQKKTFNLSEDFNLKDLYNFGNHKTPN